MARRRREQPQTTTAGRAVEADPEGRPQAVADPAWAWLEANWPANDDVLELCWGDARPGNQMYDEQGNVLGIFDWEMVSIGDAESGQQLGQDLVRLDFHIVHARIRRPWARSAIGRAVIDHAGAHGGVAKLLREVTPHLDAAQALVQEDQRRALEPVAALRHEPAAAQRPVAEVDEVV